MSYRLNTTIFYKGYTLTKKGKQFWEIAKDGAWGYATTLSEAKFIVDSKFPLDTK